MGEAALLAQVDQADVDLANRLALALSRAVEALDIPGVDCALPAIDSVLIRFDPLTVTRASLEARIVGTVSGLEPAGRLPERVVTIPVVFGGEVGPDLDDAAKALGLSPSQVVTALCERPYRVMMTGFAQGFPYIGPMPDPLNLPRRATPRTRVPAGSVAIAAGMAGIYPAELPGGWHLIGRTRVRLFDATNESRPALLQAGDGVRFVEQQRASEDAH